MTPTTPTGAGETLPEFTGKAAEALNAYYMKTEVLGKGVVEKTEALKSNLGHFSYSAYGGGETDVMKLRAAEHIYLLRNRIEVE